MLDTEMMNYWPLAFFLFDYSMKMLFEHRRIRVEERRSKNEERAFKFYCQRWQMPEMA